MEKYLIGELLSITAHTNRSVTKFSFACPANFPVLACLLKMMMLAQNLLCVQFGNTREMNEIVICTICSMVLMSQSVLNIIWKKSMEKFLQVQRVLWISETNINYCTALKKPGSIKKTPEVSSFWTQSLSIKTEDILNHSIIYKTHPVETKQEQSRDNKHLFKDYSSWSFSLWKANCTLRNS